MRLTGAPVIYDLDPWGQSDQQMHPLGAKGIASNGDIFRYARVISTGTDLIAGNLQTALANEDNHINVALSAAAAVGATSLEPTMGGTAVDANEYDEGTLAFVDTSPEGETYFIESHDSSTSGSEAITVNIYPVLKTAATTSSEVSLIRNPWNNVAISQNINEPAAGVPMIDWDVSVANFGWLKTRGVAAVLGDTAGVSDGAKVAISNQVDGAVGAPTSVTELTVGQALDASVAEEFHPVYLTID